MDTGSIILTVVGVFLLLVVIFLPLIKRSSTKAEPDNQIDADREKAYRRGLMIGGLMATMPDKPGENPQQRLERAMIEETIIEHLDHHNHQ